MKKKNRNKQHNKLQKPKARNWVAKHAHKSNKAQVEPDKKKKSKKGYAKNKNFKQWMEQEIDP